MGRCLVLELLELLLGAGSLADLQHVEEHSLAQGLTLTHWNSITSLEVPEVGHWCTDTFLWHLSQQLHFRM